MFYPCPGNLWEAEFKGDRLTNLAVEVSRKHGIQAWVISGLFIARVIVRIRSKSRAKGF
jgi:hypothetical protein